MVDVNTTPTLESDTKSDPPGRNSIITEEPLSVEEISYPDGGLRAWLVVLGVRVSKNVSSSTHLQPPGLLLDLLYIWIRELMGGMSPAR